MLSKLIFLFIIVSSIPTYSQETIYDTVEKVNREKVSILTFKYIDSLDKSRDSIFNVLNIISRDTYGTKKYEVEFFLPFKLLRLFIQNINYLLFNYSNINTIIDTIHYTITYDDNDISSSIDKYMNSQLALLSQNNFNVLLFSPVKIVNIKVPFHIFNKRDTTKKAIE